MKLTDLNPRWVGHGGEDLVGNPPRREGVALSFDCPCGKCEIPICLHLDPPLDGGAPISEHNWKRTGDTFETMTLTPFNPAAG